MTHKKTKMNIKPTKKNSYFYNEYYIFKDDERIIDSKHLYIPYHSMLHEKENKTIEIVFENGKIKYCINYINVNKVVKKSVKVESDDCISIDLGVKNLMTIYDPQ